MLEVLESEFVAAARAKGLRRARVLFAHVARNALVPTLTLLGDQHGLPDRGHGRGRAGLRARRARLADARRDREARLPGRAGASRSCSRSRRDRDTSSPISLAAGSTRGSGSDERSSNRLIRAVPPPRAPVLAARAPEPRRSSPAPRSSALIALAAILAPVISPLSARAAGPGPRPRRLLGRAPARHRRARPGRAVATALGRAHRLQVGFLAVIFPFCFGTLLGTVAGYYGGVLDSVVMRIVEVVIAFPFYVLVIALVFVVGTGDARDLHRRSRSPTGSSTPATMRSATLVVRESGLRRGCARRGARDSASWAGTSFRTRSPRASCTP